MDEAAHGTPRERLESNDQRGRQAGEAQYLGSKGCTGRVGGRGRNSRAEQWGILERSGVEICRIDGQAPLPLQPLHCGLVLEPRLGRQLVDPGAQRLCVARQWGGGAQAGRRGRCARRVVWEAGGVRVAAHDMTASPSLALLQVQSQETRKHSSKESYGLVGGGGQAAVNERPAALLLRLPPAAAPAAAAAARGPARHCRGPRH